MPDPTEGQRIMTATVGEDWLEGGASSGRVTGICRGALSA
jgi:hypothetical protein